MRRTICALSCCGALLSTAGEASADRGSIPFRPGVKIFEPNQRALIAWNGSKQILLLSTDLRASAPTKVLEVIPLPAQPQVKKGSIAVFRRATRIINRHLRRGLRVKSRNGGKRARTRGGPAGRVTFHKKIGAHDVSVTQVLDAKRFVGWVEAYLKSKGAKQIAIPKPLRQVVAEYLRDKYTWFVFDVVSLSTRPQTNDVIQYTFATPSLYYPLRITRTEQGYTRIKLIVLSSRLLRDFSGGIPIRRVRLMHRPIRINAREIANISPDFHKMFVAEAGLRSIPLRIWQISGRLSSFKKDLVAKSTRPRPRVRTKRKRVRKSRD